MRQETARGRLLGLARRRPILRAGDVARLGLHTQLLTRLVAEGVLERVGRGRYRAPGADVTEHHGLALTASSVPRARAPRVSWPPLRIVRFSGKALTDGVETHRIEGEIVRVYSLPKTIADCFKYRNKLGMEVVLEALKDAWATRRTQMTELDEYARMCRVARVMRPYLETLSA